MYDSLCGVKYTKYYRNLIFPDLPKVKCTKTQNQDKMHHKLTFFEEKIKMRLCTRVVGHHVAYFNIFSRFENFFEEYKLIQLLRH